MIRFAWIAAAATFVFHLAANPHYGFFRDELYFIMCGFRPDFGYVDQPPLVPLLAAVTQLGGHSLVLLRAVPALSPKSMARDGSFLERQMDHFLVASPGSFDETRVELSPGLIF